jgi:hypothetical protein
MTDCFLTTERSEAGYTNFSVAKVRIDVSLFQRYDAQVGVVRAGVWLWSPAPFGLLL